jgi:hypothetical protein
MKTAAPLSFFFVVLSLSLAAPARAEQILLSCSFAADNGPRQDIALEIANGRVRYGSNAGSMVNVDSLERSSLVANAGRIAFKQVWPATHVAWNWSIDRASGALTINYVNTNNGKSFLTKTGTCGGGGGWFR